MLIKDATRKDYKIVNDLLVKLNNYHADNAPDFCEHVKRYFTKKRYEKLLDKGDKWFLALDNENVVGIVGVRVWQTEKKQYTINELYVDENYRHKGIGKKLLETAMMYARRNIEENKDFSRHISLGVYEFNKDAKALYEKMGFVPQSHMLSYEI